MLRFHDTDRVTRQQQNNQALDLLRVNSMEGAQNNSGGRANKSGQQSRASVYEAHHQNVAHTLSHLRDMGHKITKVDNFDYNKSPHQESKRMAEAGMLSRSVIKHRSGKNNLKTVVKTQFNTEGMDHDCKVETGPDDEKEKDEKDDE